MSGECEFPLVVNFYRLMCMERVRGEWSQRASARNHLPSNLVRPSGVVAQALNSVTDIKVPAKRCQRGSPV